MGEPFTTASTRMEGRLTRLYRWRGVYVRRRPERWGWSTYLAARQRRYLLRSPGTSTRGPQNRRKRLRSWRTGAWGRGP